MKGRMNTNRSGQGLVEVVTVLRGLLAETTGDADRPYKPVILKVSTSRADLELAATGKRAKKHQRSASSKKTITEPLYLDIPVGKLPVEKLREQLQSGIDEYRRRYSAKPETVCLRGLAVVRIAKQGTGKGLALENKVAVVTGSAGAIGYGVCQGLLENGCFLAATDLAGERFDDFIRDLKTTGGDRVCGVPMDVTRPASVSRAFEKVIRTWGGIDIVVVNAGVALVSYLKEMDLEAFRRLEKVNVEGALLTLREAAGHLITQGTGGDIVVMSTKNVPCPGAGFGAYSATKAACHQLGRLASIELAEYGIRVNMVAPDAVFSEGRYKSGLWNLVGPDRMRARGLDETGLQEYYRNRNLLKARVTGRHVANAVLFFATRQTPTTGATIPVDGGLPDATPR